MYVRSIHIENVKLLRDLKMSFLREGEPRMWTVFVAENGLCKTTLLQSIALAACGPERANQLANIPALRDRRQSKPRVLIESEFEFGTQWHADRTYPGLSRQLSEPPRIRSTLELRWGLKYLEASSSYEAGAPSINGSVPDPLKSARLHNYPFWFVAGYGVDRSLPLPKFQNSSFEPEPLASLFAKGPIIGTGFADLFDKTDRVRSFGKILRQCLLEGKQLLPRITGIDLRGKGGVKQAKQIVESHRFEFQAGQQLVKIPATWLSQGYQALIAWVADLVGHMFWDSNRAIEPEQMEGLVLIDELDLHLHPTWQLTLIESLKSTFPKVQFVCTTHSPMLLPGLKQDEIWLLKQNAQGDVEVHAADQSPLLMTGSEIYSEFFGIDRLYPNEMGEKLLRFGYLMTMPDRTPNEQQQFLALQRELAAAGIEPPVQPAPNSTP